MQSENDKKIWDGYADSINVDFYIDTYMKNPAVWHKSLVQYINAAAMAGGSTIEVGSFSGITTLMLDNKFDKTILDYSVRVLEKAQELFNRAGQPVKTICADMFNIPAKGGSYDVVFNSGVIEHLDFADRVAHLKENARIMKDDGVMIIAYPNHSSWYYRLSYLLLKRRGEWNYPDENKLFSLKNEIREAGLVLVEKKVFDPQTSLTFLFRHSRCRNWIYAVARTLRLGGYLMVLKIRKADLNAE